MLFSKLKNAGVAGVLFCSALIIFLAGIDAWADEPGLRPGLVGQYFAMRHRDEPREQVLSQTPDLVRIDAQINFPGVDGEFHGTKLTDAFIASWEGELKIETAGEYEFHALNDQGVSVAIDGKALLNFVGGSGAPEKVSAKVTLAAGQHALRYLMREEKGVAAAVLRWTPPGGKEEVTPAGVLFHRPEQAAVKWNSERWERMGPKEISQILLPGIGFPYQKFGSVLAASFKAGSHRGGDNIAYRGLIVRLDASGESCMAFDADTMRMAAGWTDGGLALQGLPFTGSHGVYPRHVGEPIFTTKASPGWLADANSEGDPRTGEYPKLGPLPKEWAHFQGYYVQGEKVALKYSVGKTVVLESPGVAKVGDSKCLTRAFQIEAHDERFTLILANAGDNACTVVSRKNLGEEKASGEAEKSMGVLGAGTKANSRVTGVVVSGDTVGAVLSAPEGELRLELPAATATTRIVVAYERCAKEDLAELAKFGETLKRPDDMTGLTKGGPRRWTETLATKGTVAKNESAFVVDTLTAPTANPYSYSASNGDMKFGGFDFFSNGTSAAVSTWDGDVWIVSGIDEKLENLSWQRFATGLHQPLGLKIVNDVVYVVSNDQITRFHDLNKDGEADFYENFNNDWEVTSAFHAFTFDLQTDAQGNFYFAFGSPVRPGGSSFERLSRHHGSIIKVSADGSRMERYASGLRAPNGIAVNPVTGQVTCGDNEGTFVPRCPIHWIGAGDFLGVVDVAEKIDQLKTTPTVRQQGDTRPETLVVSEAPRPLVWLPKQIDNSGGGQVWVQGDRWGLPQGTLLHTSYGTSSLYLVLPEKKGKQMQGAVVKIPVKFTSSAMRSRFNSRDGQLYVAGLRGWQTNATANTGFDRVRYTGLPFDLPVGMQTSKRGITLTFSRPLDAGEAENTDNYTVTASDVLWSHKYGSADYELGQREMEPAKWKQGKTELEVTSAKLQGNGRELVLELANFQAAHQLLLSLNVKGADGKPIKLQLSGTIHATE